MWQDMSARQRGYTFASKKSRGIMECQREEEDDTGSRRSFHIVYPSAASCFISKNPKHQPNQDEKKDAQLAPYSAASHSSRSTSHAHNCTRLRPRLGLWQRVPGGSSRPPSSEAGVVLGGAGPQRQARDTKWRGCRCWMAAYDPICAGIRPDLTGVRREEIGERTRPNG